jgi:acetoin utilization protein AcuB
MKKLEIQSVMHPFPHTIGVDQKLSLAKEMMLEHNIRHLPVQKGGQLVGVLTDRDINFALAVDGTTPENLTVEEACTLEPYLVAPTESVATVARRMAHDHIGCTLIAQNGKLIGIFTTVDACRVLSEALSGSMDQ